jgi:hypothetical protein
MDLQKVGGVCRDWMELAQDRDRWRTLVNRVMNFRVSKMRGISWLAAEPVSFSRMTLLHGVSKKVTCFLAFGSSVVISLMFRLLWSQENSLDTCFIRVNINMLKGFQSIPNCQPFSACPHFQTSCGSCMASYPMLTRGSFPCV